MKIKRIYKDVSSIVLALFIIIAALGSCAPPSREPSKPEVKTRQARPSHLLYLVNTPPFDPLVKPPQIPLYLTATDAKEYYVLQFHETADESVRDWLTASGVTFYGYIPNYGFIVKMSDGVKMAVKGLDIARAVITFHPAYRLSPSLRKEDTSGLLRYLDVYVFGNLPGVNYQIEAILDNLNGKSLQLDDAGMIQVVVPPENLTEAIRQIAFIPDVRWIEETPHFEPLNDVATKVVHATDLWSSEPGLTGKGQVIGIADTGLDTGADDKSMHDDIEGRIVKIHNWPVQKSSSYLNPNDNDGAADEHTKSTTKQAGHGTCVTGSALGNGTMSSSLSAPIKGVAYEAKVVFQAVEQWTYLAATLSGGKARWDYALSGIPLDPQELFSEAYKEGARIHNNSWGDHLLWGKYSYQSNRVDDFMWEHPDMLVLFGAGNEGADLKPSDGKVDSGSVIVPSTAKNCISVGATETKRGSSFEISPYTTYGAKFPMQFPLPPITDDHISSDPNKKDEMYARSSRGLTDDNRIKPDIVAPGTFILSTRSSKLNKSVDLLWGRPSDAGYSSNLDDDYIFAGGTSLAAPLVSGSAALIRQYLMDVKKEKSPSAALIKGILINGADDSGVIPNGGEGWGRINLESSLSKLLQYYDVKPGIFDGQANEFEIDVESSEPLRITLIWTDYPGTINASRALINDLNLRVSHSGSGITYYGNNFANGWSTDKASVLDKINNVENIYIEKPKSGTYKIRIHGLQVPQAPQPYALVVRGAKSMKSPSPSFTVKLSPDKVKIPRGATAEYKVGAYFHFNFDKDVTLNHEITKSDPTIAGKLSKSKLAPSTSAPYFDEGNLYVYTKSKTPPDTYKIEIKGTSNGLKDSDSAQLIVRSVDAIAVWQHEVILEPKKEVKDWDIWYSIWDATAGIWWSHTEAAAAAVYPQLPTDDDNEHDRDPAIAFDTDGNAMVVWARQPIPSAASDYDVWYSRWVGSGFVWGWEKPKSLCKLKGDDTDPAVAMDTDDSAIAIWVHNDEKAKKRRIYYSSRRKGENWSDAAPLVTQTPETSQYPGQASLPEITFIAKKPDMYIITPIGSKKKIYQSEHQAVAIWLDIAHGEHNLGYSPHYLIWNGHGWKNEYGGQRAYSIPQKMLVGWPHVDTSVQPQATHRLGISSDKSGNAHAVWSIEDKTTYNNKVDAIYYAKWDGKIWNPRATRSPGRGVQPATAYDTYLKKPITVYSCTGVSPCDIRYFIDAGVATGANSKDIDRRPVVAILPNNQAMTVWWSDGAPESEIWYSNSGTAMQQWKSGKSIIDMPDLRDWNPAIASPTGSPSRPPESYP